MFLNPTTIEIAIRKEAKFHNGRYMKASDVVASLEYLRESRGVLRNIFSWIREIQIRGPRTIHIHLSRHLPQFLTVLSAPNYAIFSEEFLKKAKSNQSLWSNPMGCGNYQITRYDPKGEFVELEPIHEGLPIRFHFVGENQVSKKDAPQYDLIGLPIVGGEVTGETFRTEKLFDPYHIFMGLNTHRPQWSRREDRCQFFSRLDPEKPLQSYGPNAERATDILPRGILGFSTKENYQEKIRSWKHEWKPKSDSFCLSILSVSVPKKNRSAFVDMVRSVFSNVQLKIVDNPARFGFNFVNSSCDGMIVGLKSNYLDAYEYLLIFSETDPNLTGYNSAALKKMVQESQDVEGSKARAELYQEISDQVKNECLLYPILTIQMKTIFVKKSRKTPGLGTVPLNEYYLGSVR